MKDTSIFQVVSAPVFTGDLYKISGTMTNEENLTWYLRIPLNFIFSFFCSPFRLVINKLEKSDLVSFSSKAFWPHTVLCIIFTFFDILWMIAFVRNSIPSHSSNPALFLALLKTVAVQISKFAFLRKVWFHQQDFARLANFLSTEHKNQGLPSLKSKWYNGKFAVFAICVLYTFVGLWHAKSPTVLGPGSVERTNCFVESVNLWWLNMIDGGRKIFFIDDISKGMNYTVELIEFNMQQLSWLDICLGIAGATGRLHRFARL